MSYSNCYCLLLALPVDVLEASLHEGETLYHNVTARRMSALPGVLNAVYVVCSQIHIGDENDR
ncbi:hypothetical protein HOLleu_35296 [Holothuria leucospilota]|uniref:Uncharacterized protein n=1 Tax=Holothuria leucospilota TaxID=206669 RepID=A0A9Q0YME2_HOLLE|nr:hypothetical protein HOLleu_35296 [Holothuria leucospilota]